MNSHPITPPFELVQQWGDVIPWTEALTQAARWGADQELEACCALLDKFNDGFWCKELHAARRPKPPSLKQQALEELETLRGDLNAHGLGFDAPVIRRVLEALPDE